jgi:hypothetical protein
MKYFTIILALILMINSIESFKSNEFCKKNNSHECINYDCGEKLCSINKKSCMDLLRWGNLIKVNIEKDMKKNKYNKFLKNIKSCEKKFLKNQKIYRIFLG